MKKRIFALVALLTVFSTVLAGCAQAVSTPTEAPAAVPPTVAPTIAPTTAPAAAPTAAPATTAPTQPPAPPTAAPVYLSINTEQVPTWVRNFNPFSPDARGPTATIIYEPMMIYNKATAKLVPWLATEYSWSADDLTLTFKIRQGVKWSDGQPFSAKDVIYTFDLLKNNPALPGVVSPVLAEYVDTYSAPDDFTVVVKFKTVQTTALYDLANQFIVPEHIWKDVADPQTFTNDNPVGTGPFTQVTRFEDQIYILEKNPNYWQPGKPAIQGLRFPVYPGNDQANLALVNGELDWAGNFVPDADKTYVDKNPTDFHYYYVGGDGIMLYLNPALKPFDNPEVRKAISMGIDRKMMVNVAEFDYIPPLDATGLSEQYKTWKSADAVAAGTWTNYDVAKANAMLDAAGLKKGADGIRLDKSGKPMKYELIVVSGWTDWVSACQIIAQNMKDLGIDISVQTPEYNAYIDQLGKGHHQWAIGSATGGPTPFNFYRGQMSQLTFVKVGDDAADNFNRYVDPEADKLLEAFAKSADPAQQKSLMDQLQMRFVNDVPALPLFPGPDWYEYVTTRFTGFPTKDDPYAHGPPYATPGSYESPLLVVTNIKPK
jgi:peptide/nickel transport system substrate-binding protein